MDKVDKIHQAHEFGKFAEEIASQYYLRNGYVILERNWRLRKTEIDLIAQKDDLIVIAEVKARSGEDEEALSAVTTDKRKRMIKAADFYLKSLPGLYNYRFDIITMTGNIEKYQLDVYEDAFLAADIF
ncbi:MAG: YraN family protein [Muribaculaceae bacterium]|nr:YraN family protein [Muribaculaceae bacterium]